MKIDISELAPHIIEQLSDEELEKVDVKGISYANEQQIEALGERVTLLPKDVKLVLTDETNRSLLTQQQKHLLGLQVQEVIYPMTVQETNHNRPSVTQEVNQEIVHEPRNQMAKDDPFINKIKQYVQDAKDKPYAVFVGMSGNGKTCMLDLLVRTLQGGVGLIDGIVRRSTNVNTIVPVEISNKQSRLLDTAGENFQAWFKSVTNTRNLEVELAFSKTPLKDTNEQTVTPEQNQAFGCLLKNASKLYICTPAKRYGMQVNINVATNFLCEKLNINGTKPELIFLFNHVDSLIYDGYQDQLPSLSNQFHDYSKKLNKLNQVERFLFRHLDQNITLANFEIELAKREFSIDTLNKDDNKSSLGDYAIVNLDFISELLTKSKLFIDENSEYYLNLEQRDEAQQLLCKKIRREKELTIGELKKLITNEFPKELKYIFLNGLEQYIKEGMFLQYKVDQKFIAKISNIYKQNIDDATQDIFQRNYFNHLDDDNNADILNMNNAYSNFVTVVINNLLENENENENESENENINITANILKPKRLNIQLLNGIDVSVKYCYLLYLPHYLDHYKMLELEMLGPDDDRATLANIIINDVGIDDEILRLYQQRFKKIFSLNEFLTFDGRMMAKITRNSQEIKQSVLKDKFTIQYIISSILIALIMGVVSYFFIFDYQQIKENVPGHKIAYMIGVDESKPNPFIALEEKALENLYVHFIENDPKKNTQSACMKTLNTTNSQETNSQETNSQAKAQTHNKENKSTQNKAKCFNHLVTLHKQNQPWQETEINALLQLLSVSTKIDQVDFKKEQLLLEAWSARKLRGEKARVFALNEHELRLMQDYLPSNIPSGIWHNKQVRNCPPNDIQENRLCDAFRATFTTTGKEFNAIRPIDIKPDNMKSFCSKNMRFCETHKNGLHTFLFGLCIFILGFLFILWKKKNTKSE